MSTTNRSINLVTPLPGPQSAAIVARRERAMANGASKLTQIAVASGQGAVVTDVDGNQLLDFAGGIGVLAAGHCPPSVVEAVRSQAESLLHMCAIVATYEPLVAVAELLNEITPGTFDKKTVLMNSGAEAVETAVNVARSATGRQAIVVFEGAYHGRTNLTAAMTSKYALFKKGYAPFAPEIYRFDFPNVYRRPEEMSEKGFIDWSVARLRDQFISRVDPAAVAAVVIEPVQGEGGFIPVPTAFMEAIRELCDEHGMVMIADEIQSGMGRTGKLFAIEHSGVVPDIVTTAKSLGSGMPISAITGRAELMDAPHPGGLGGTYSGNPLACVAAIESIKLISDVAFLEHASAIGDHLRRRLEELQTVHPDLIGDVRGLGPMLVAEIVMDSESKKPDMASTAAICAATLVRGLITIRAGLYSNCVRFLPPLGITHEQVDEAMDVLEEAVAEVAAAR
ncbi:MAG: aspartate aminotransferase family protein [Acidimicrobiia bacterium]|nr:aspartate aminotransferase family protein [Acidimicrobiia bacterium]